MKTPVLSRISLYLISQSSIVGGLALQIVDWTGFNRGHPKHQQGFLPHPFSANPGINLKQSGAVQK